MRSDQLSSTLHRSSEMVAIQDAKLVAIVLSQTDGPVVNARQGKGSLKLGLPAFTSTPPSGDLELQRVWGYRGHDCKGSVVLNGEGRIIYCASAVCVVDDTATDRQRFFQAHADTVVSLALHPDMRTVASGGLSRHSCFDAERLALRKMVCIDQGVHLRCTALEGPLPAASLHARAEGGIRGR